MSENFVFNANNASDVNSTSTSTIPSFSSFRNADGTSSEPVGGFSNDKKKTKINEIIDQPITITAVNKRKSNFEEGKEYLVIEYINANGEECYTSTGSSGIRSAIENKGANLQFPCRATVIQCISKSHPGWKYLTLN